MSNRLTDDQIKWVLSLDAKGVQSELTTLTGETQKFQKENKLMRAELKAAEKQMASIEKEMVKMREQGKANTSAYRELEKTYHSVGEEIADYSRRIRENNAAIEQSRQKADALTKTLKVQDMTMDQLTKQARDLERQLNRTSLSAEPDAYRALEKELLSVKSRMSELKGGSQDAFSVFKGAAMVAVGNLFSGIASKIGEAVSRAKEFVKESIEMAKGAEGVVAAFNRLNSPNLLANLRRETKGTLSDLQLMQRTVQADKLGIPVESMGKLLQFARKSAVDLGKDFDYMTNSIIEGLGKQSPRILDNLGISQVRLRAEVKKTGDFTKAAINIVNEELAKQGDAAEMAADRAARKTAAWDNAMLAVGKRFKWVGELNDTISINVAKHLESWAGDTRTVTERYDDQLATVADLNVNIAPLIDKYEKMSESISIVADENGNLTPEQQELLSVINQISAAIPGAISGWDNYGNALGINTERAREFLKQQIELLKYTNQAAIAQTEADIERLTRQRDALEQNRARGGNTTTVGGTAYSPGTEVFTPFSPEQQASMEKQIADYTALINGAQTNLKKINGTALEEQVRNSEAELKQRQEFNAKNKKELDAWIKDTANANSQYMAMAKQMYNQRFGAEYADPDKDAKEAKKAAKEQKTSLNILIEGLEATHLERMAAIRQKYLSGEITTEAQHDRELFAQEQSYQLLREQSLTEFLKTVKNEELKSDIGKQIAVLQDQRLEQELTFRTKLEKVILDADPAEKERQAYAERLEAIGLFGQSAAALRQRIEAAATDEERAAAQQKYDAFLLLEQQHNDNMLKIRANFRRLDKQAAEEQFEAEFGERKEQMQADINDLTARLQLLSGNEQFEAEIELHAKRMAMLSEEIAARKRAGLDTVKLEKDFAAEQAKTTAIIRRELKDRMQSANQYGKAIGTAFGEVLSGQKTMLEAFGDSLLDILFDQLANIINTKIMEATAVSVAEQAKAAAIATAMPDSVATFGATGILRTAAIGAIITGALTAAKTALKGLMGKKKSGASSTPSASGRNIGQIVPNGFAEGGYNEGYTGAGEKYDVRGFFPNGQPYHAGEYIIPKRVLSLPSVVPMVRQIESLRRQQTSANPLPKGFAEGGFNAPEGGAPEESVLFPVLARLTAVLDTIEKNGVSANIGVTELQAKQQRKSAIDRQFSNL